MEPQLQIAMSEVSRQASEIEQAVLSLTEEREVSARLREQLEKWEVGCRLFICMRVFTGGLC